MVERPTFSKIAELTLDKFRHPLTPFEIWEHSEEIRKSIGFSTGGKTPWQSIGAQIYVDIRGNPNSVFYQYSNHPVKFYLTRYKDSTNIAIERRAVDKKEPFDERDLHPLLVRYVNGNSHFQAECKTIFHESSTRRAKGQNEWLHPDLVAVHFPFEEYAREVLTVQKHLGLSALRLFSFEMKISLRLSNLRESYFQAVSNSSWANEGYLVAMQVDRESSFTDELRRLNSAFGIGIIELDPQDADQSQILFPSRLNSQLDWNTVNRLAEDNPNFGALLGNIGDSLQIGKVTGKYDEVLDPRRLQEFVTSKKVARV